MPAPTRTSCTCPPPTSPAPARAWSPRPASTTPSTGAPSWPPRCSARAEVERDSRRPEVLRKALDDGPHASTARPARSRRRGRRAGPQEWVDRAAGRLRPAARAEPRLARRLHLHQGAGRAGRRGAAAPAPAAVDRAAGDRGERAALPVPGLDRRLQDGRPADHRVRPRHPAGVPRRARRRRSTSIPVDIVVERHPRGRRHPASRGRAGVLPRRLRLAEPADLPRPVRDHPRATSPRTRCPTAAAATIRVPPWSFPGAPPGRPDAAAPASARVDLAEKALLAAARRPSAPATG